MIFVNFIFFVLSRGRTVVDVPIVWDWWSATRHRHLSLPIATQLDLSLNWHYTKSTMMSRLKVPSTLHHNIVQLQFRHKLHLQLSAPVTSTQIPSFPACLSDDGFSDKYLQHMASGPTLQVSITIQQHRHYGCGCTEMWWQCIARKSTSLSTTRSLLFPVRTVCAYL